MAEISEEYQKEVDGVMKTFITVDGVEYEVIPVYKLNEETGEPLLDENGDPVIDVVRDDPTPEFTDSSPPIKDE